MPVEVPSMVRPRPQVVAPGAPVRVAVVGCGNISGAYGETMSAYPSVSIAGATDIERSLSAAFVDRFGGVHYPSLDDVLADADVDAIVNLTFPAATAADLMARVPDLCVSTGSACSSATIEPSYVLRALGLSDDAAARTLRIGIGRFTSPADIDYAAAALAAAHAGAPAPAIERYAQA